MPRSKESRRKKVRSTHLSKRHFQRRRRLIAVVQIALFFGPVILFSLIAWPLVL